MSAQAMAMPTPSDTLLSSHKARLPRWPIVLFPIVMAAATGFFMVHTMNHTILPFALRLATTAGLGLIAGFASRRTLRDRRGIIRWLVALAALAVGLLLLGLLTRGNAGIGSPDPSLGGPDWNGLTQLFLGSLAVTLALRAWSARARPAAGRPLRRRPVDAWEAFTSRLRASWETSAMRRGMRHLRTLSEQLRRRLEKARTAARPVERLSAYWRAFHGAGAQSRQFERVRLIGAEEYRCPFCLDRVQQNNSRGVVVCPVCHAQHHADCWGVTGMCQVPHYHK